RRVNGPSSCPPDDKGTVAARSLARREDNAQAGPGAAPCHRLPCPVTVLASARWENRLGRSAHIKKRRADQNLTAPSLGPQGRRLFRDRMGAAGGVDDEL